jgi:hypothetical protein
MDCIRRREYNKRYYEEHKEKIKESYRERAPIKMIEKASAGGYLRIPYAALKRYGMKKITRNLFR